ncbi:MAG: hypothetical protein V1841_00450 [Patescibacteria group bacterium]
MNTRRENIHGFFVEFDPTEKEIIYAGRYLRDDLQLTEAKTFFDAARLNGSADFEDDYDRDWTIIYNRGTNVYNLVRRQRE